MESTRKKHYEPMECRLIEVHFSSLLCASGVVDGGINSMLIDTEIDGNEDFI